MKSEFVKAKDIKSHFIQFGSGPKKMIFLHGWGGSTESFEKLAPKISNKNNVEVILLDLPGFGRSGFPPKKGWNTQDYADWLTEILKQLKIKKCIFYGHSFGCRVIVRFLSKHSGAAEKVILTGAAGIKWPPTKREKVSLFLSKRFRLAKNFVPQVIQKFVITRIFGARDWGAVVPGLKTTLEKVLAEKDFRSDLSKLKMPFLLIWGKKDQITPLKSGKVYEEKLPNAELVILEDGRHGVHRTHEVEILKLITKFLSNK